MRLRSLGTAALRGGLFGALPFGGVISLEHVVYNRVPSLGDRWITLAVCALLYGLWAAAFFLFAWLLRTGFRLVRRRSAAGGEAEAWYPGVLFFNLVFWEA